MATYAEHEDPFTAFFEDLDVEVEETNTQVLLQPEQQVTPSVLRSRSNPSPSSKTTPPNRPAQPQTQMLLPSVVTHPPALHGPLIKQRAHPNIISCEYDLPSRTDLIPLQTTVNTVLDHLKAHGHVSDADNNLVYIEAVGHSSTKCLLHNYEAQHTEMNAIVQRLHELVKLTEEQEKVHSHATTNSVKIFAASVMTIKRRGNNRWDLFVSCLKDLLTIERDYVCENFKTVIENKCRSLVKDGCVRMISLYEKELKESTNNYLREFSIEKSFERIKLEAFRAFNIETKSLFKSENGADDGAFKILGKYFHSVYSEYRSASPLKTMSYSGMLIDRFISEGQRKT